MFNFYIINSEIITMKELSDPVVGKYLKRQIKERKNGKLECQCNTYHMFNMYELVQAQFALPM